MLHGFLNLAKPRGLTSHDVVARVRSLTGQRRAGHAGTLDPLAEGVLPIALGRATRLADRVGAGEKTYLATVHLGVTTATDDAEGQVVRQVELPALSANEVEAVLAPFRGQIQQAPPLFSALKVHGRRAYRLARAGQAVALPPRPVTIYELRLLEWRSPMATVLVRCSRGTYVRALARDIGRAADVGAHLAALVRLAVGPFELGWAISLEELAALAGAGQLASALVPPDLALLDLPALVVSLEREENFLRGRAWPSPPPPVQGLVRAYAPDGRLLGLMDYDSADGRWRPRLAFPGSGSG